MAIIQRTGSQATFEARKESTRGGVRKPVAVFLRKTKKLADAVKFE